MLPPLGCLLPRLLPAAVHPHRHHRMHHLLPAAPAAPTVVRALSCEERKNKTYLLLIIRLQGPAPCDLSLAEQDYTYSKG